jgi:hypothetical protein
VNKWLVFPLVIMISMLCCAVVIGNNLGNANNYGQTNTYQNWTINGDTGHATDGSTSTTSFDLSSVNVIIAFLSIAIAAGIAAGIHVLGTGLSQLSQELTIKLIVYAGMWACLTALVGSYFNNLPIFGPMIYIMLTVMYVLGFIADLRTVGGE